MTKLKHGLSTSDGWNLTESCVELGELIDSGSRFMVGNGYLGYRGTFCDWTAQQYVACVVTNTWDKAEGENLTELCNVPNALYTYLRSEGQLLDSLNADTDDVKSERSLDLLHGKFIRCTHFKNQGVTFTEERMAMANPVHGLVARFTIHSDVDREFSLYSGIDTDVWSLTGDHMHHHKLFHEDGFLGVKSSTQEKNIKIFVIEQLSYRELAVEESVEYYASKLLRKLKFKLSAGQSVSFDKFATIYSSKDCAKPKAAALNLCRQLRDRGFEDLAQEIRECWQERWSNFDIEIADNVEDQILVRFNTYQSFIATPAHAPLPLGARGLSCQVYQGAAFWDVEIFNLPMYLYTAPAIARNLLEYRYRTLDGARAKAARLGFKGAFYAWASGETGDELFPSFFFKDLFSGRPFRNYFNSWQIHVSPAVAFGVQRYVSISGDITFLEECGAEILFEVARFIVSRVAYRYDRDRCEVLRVIGPDEYHENVDNNAYTNFMLKQSLGYAIEAFEMLEKLNLTALGEICSRIKLDVSEVEQWREVSAKLYVPRADDATGLIEQFEGYFDLEDVTPEVLRERLIKEGEYWGCPQGVAVYTQVLKQADVVQLLALFDHFDPVVYRANYDYYEPRTEHGSSLSPAMHAIVACRAGRLAEAYRYFKESAVIDFYGQSRKKKSGGKFLGGIHTAAAGAIWYAIVEGFVGVAVREQILHLNPNLPAEWRSVKFSLNIHQRGLKVTVSHNSLKIEADNGNPNPQRCCLQHEIFEVGPGQVVERKC